MLIDTHCHLEDENFDSDRVEVIDRAKIAGVEKIINFGSTLASSIKIPAQNLPSLPPIKKSWRLAKSGWIITGKRIRSGD